MKRLSQRQQPEPKNHKSIRIKNINKRLAVIIVLSLFGISALGLNVSGLSGRFVSVYPLIEIGQKSTTLTCNYNGKNLSTNVITYSNINNYYKGLPLKNGVDDGEYKQIIYSHPSDDTLDSLVEDIKGIARSNALTDDQTIELATCFIQNIPYDEEKAEIVLGDATINNYDLSQTPYETLHNNSGICTDKTYLGSMIMQKLGYSTAIMLFPDAEHMALGIKAPSGYGDFNTKYAYMELTTPGFAPGEVPENVSDANGKPAVSVKNFNELTSAIDPSSLNIYSGETISMPNAVMEINDGKSYDRIKLVVDLENRIVSGYENLISRQDVLEQSYAELIRRENYQESLYSIYSSTPSTTYECGYEYNYGYTWNSYSYGYTSPYTYECDWVSNPRKSSAYSSYSYAYNSYEAQINHYNKLIDDYNAVLVLVQNDISRYKSYDYN